MNSAGKEARCAPLSDLPPEGPLTSNNFLRAFAESFLPMAWAEIERHKWLESEKARRDLGHQAIEDWLRRFWWLFCRWRRFEHLEGERCWREFNDLDFALLRKVAMERELLEAVIKRMKGDGTHLHDNLEIIFWALGDASINYQRVEEFLQLIDINSARLPTPSNWRFTSAA